MGVVIIYLEPYVELGNFYYIFESDVPLGVVRVYFWDYYRVSMFFLKKMEIFVVKVQRVNLGNSFNL